MKIAFLMQCHKNPEYINFLLNELKYPRVDVFVHVDTRNKNIRKNIVKREGVYLLPDKDCVDVKWAQFSQVQATLNLLKTAISNRGGDSHYFLISGQNFPLKFVEEIVEFLDENKKVNFIDCFLVKKFEKKNDIFFHLS